MIAFDPAHRAVHYPPDRRFRIWIRPSILIGVAVAILSVDRGGLDRGRRGRMPHVPAVPQIYPNNFAGPHGFPVWVRYCHFFNFLFVMLLIRSGLSILMDHPRLYFNDGCTPGSEWIRFTPLKVPRDRIWTAKDDARYISPLVGTPGYRHTIGIARVWHFIDVHGFIVTGIFLSSCSSTPSSGGALCRLRRSFSCRHGTRGCTMRHFICHRNRTGFMATTHCNRSPISPSSLSSAPGDPYRDRHVAGGGESLSLVCADLWRQAIGPIHPLPHDVQLPCIPRRTRHVDCDDRICAQYEPYCDGHRRSEPSGMYLGFVGIGVVVLSWVVAHYISWHHPRGLQHALKSVTYPMQLITLNRLIRSRSIRRRKSRRTSGRMENAGPRRLEAHGGNWLRDFRLKVGGLVEKPVELSLADLERLGEAEHITMHHCIQGWSGIAKWGGIPMKTLIELVRPKPEAKVVAFFSFGEALYGGPYYDTQSLENVLKPQCLLASRMNGQRLPQVYGAPLRLRVENQLGYKMVKWIERIEFIESEKMLGKGEGGKNEDDEYFDLLPNI